jgi:TolB protein
MKNVKNESRASKKILWLLLLLLIVLLIVLGALNLDKIKQTAAYESVRQLVSGASGEEDFSFDAYYDNIFAEMSGGLVVASSSAYQVLNPKGEKIAGALVSLPEPVITASSGGAVIWSEETGAFILILPDGKAKSVKNENAVISASVSDNGYFAVATEEPNYKGLVTVYDRSFEPVYKWYSGEAYLMGAALNPSGTELFAVTAGGEGSRVVRYSLSGEDPLGAYADEGDILIDEKFISASRFCAISDKKLLFLSASAELSGSYDFSDKYLKDYSLDGSGFAALVLGSHRTGGVNELVTVNPNGEVMGKTALDSEIKHLSAGRKYVCAVYADKTVIYDTSLDVKKVFDNSAGVNFAFICGNGSAIMLSGSEAVQAEF